MQELDDNVEVLPKDADIPPEYEPEQSTVVDIGSIQTDPKTSVYWQIVFPNVFIIFNL